MLGGILAAVLVLGGGLWLLQRRLIYLPAGGVPEVTRVLPGWDDVTLQTSDGLALGAWYRYPEPDEPVVIVFNGNAGHREGRALLGARLADHGFGVLLFDYRGYGDNPGRPTEDGLARDARAALAFVGREAPGHPVVYFGESLGAAVAIELATATPPDALVLRSPFTSLADVAAVHYSWLPVSALLWDEYPSLDRIGSIDVPLLVIAGSADSIVPVAQSRRLYEAASQPRQLVIVAGADHNDLALLAGDRLVAAVVAFIAEHISA